MDLKKEADSLHFSNVPSNFGDDTYDQLLPSSFHQNYTRKISDQDYDRCEIQQEPKISDSMAFDEEDEPEQQRDRPSLALLADQFECVDAFIED